MPRAFNAKTLEEEKAAILRHCKDISDASGSESKRRSAVATLDFELKLSSREVRDDEEVAFCCLSHSGGLLYWFSTPLRANRELVLVAVTTSGGWALSHAGRELQGDREIVLAAVSNHGSGLESASEELRADRELVLLAVSRGGAQLRYASKELQSDREVVLAAVSNCGDGLRFASAQLRHCKEVVLQAVRNKGSALQYASRELQADKEVVLAAVQNDGAAILEASEELQADREVFFAAAETGLPALELFSLNLRNDLDFVLRFASLSKRPSLLEGIYAQAGAKVLEAISFEKFVLAVTSGIAVAGQPEPAPTVLVNLAKRSSDGTGGEAFQVEATLLSGEQLVFDLHVEGQAHPVLRDLAQQLMQFLRRRAKIDEQQKNIFITFLKCGGDERIVVTTRDHDRCLSEFLRVDF